MTPFPGCVPSKASRTASAADRACSGSSRSLTTRRRIATASATKLRRIGCLAQQTITQRAGVVTVKCPVARKVTPALCCGSPAAPAPLPGGTALAPLLAGSIHTSSGTSQYPPSVRQGPLERTGGPISLSGEGGPAGTHHAAGLLSFKKPPKVYCLGAVVNPGIARRNRGPRLFLV